MSLPPYVPPFLDELAAANYLGLAPKTLARWRWARKGPCYRKFGAAVRYAVSDLDSFAATAVVVL